MHSPGWVAFRFAAGALLVFAAAYAASELADPVNPALKARVAILRERGPEIEAVAVGNSHGGTVEFDALDMEGMHFTAAGQDAFEGVYLARYAMAGAPRLRFVLFTAPYGVAWKDHAVVGASDLRARRRQLYARTPRQGYIAGDRGSWVRGLVAPVVRDDHWSGVVRRFVRPGPPLRYGADGRAIRPDPGPPPEPDSLARYGARIGAAHTVLGQEMVSLAPDTPARVATALGALATDLRARGVALVLFTPPYHESYLRTHDPSVNADARALLERVVAENPNAVWLDYSADPRFRDRHHLFNNSDHLNRAGGHAFSRLLRECLRSTLAGSRTAGWDRGCPSE